ncbi:hypothetical protein [Aeromicrobium sp. UC242_57]|uniref:hypothetical protein n=1 Tax=Aeromicrobium sp. UC242_57 TaxID=3374624 RepID=UPI0037B21210
MLQEWLEIEFGTKLDDELFTWEGTTISSQSYGSYDEEPHDAASRREKKWLRKSGLDGRLRVHLKPEFHEVDQDSGAFEGGFSDAAWFSLGRRLPSTEPWDEPDDFTHEVRWEDGSWQWRLRSTHRIRKRTLKHLRRQTRTL